MAVAVTVTVTVTVTVIVTVTVTMSDAWALVTSMMSVLLNTIEAHWMSGRACPRSVSHGLSNTCARTCIEAVLTIFLSCNLHGSESDS